MDGKTVKNEAGYTETIPEFHRITAWGGLGTSVAKHKNFDAMVAWDREINCVEDRTIVPIWERIRNERRSRGEP